MGGISIYGKILRSVLACTVLCLYGSLEPFYNFLYDESYRYFSMCKILFISWSFGVLTGKHLTLFRDNKLIN